MESPTRGSSALFVAHPGHELRVHGWLEHSRPHVFILTDGSGHGGRSRLKSSEQMIEEAGASRGSIFGRFTDRQVYAALLACDDGLFRGLAAELADCLIARGVTTIAGDAIEGYNPAHDICRLVIDAAVTIGRSRGAAIDNYDFAVVGGWADDATMIVNLDDAAFDRKIRAARAYAEMQGEVDTAIAAHTVDSFRCERFRLREPAASLMPPHEKPFYETHGERQVAAGIYRNVVRYREHIAPLNEAVLAAADRPTCVR